MQVVILDRMTDVAKAAISRGHRRIWSSDDPGDLRWIHSALIMHTWSDRVFHSNFGDAQSQVQPASLQIVPNPIYESFPDIPDSTNVPPKECDYNNGQPSFSDSGTSHPPTVCIWPDVPPPTAPTLHGMFLCPPRPYHYPRVSSAPLAGQISPLTLTSEESPAAVSSPNTTQVVEAGNVNSGVDERNAGKSSAWPEVGHRGVIPTPAYLPTEPQDVEIAAGPAGRGESCGHMLATELFRAGDDGPEGWLDEVTRGSEH